MATDTRSGFGRAEVVQPIGPIGDDRRERARVVASLAEYLAPEVEAHPDRAPEAMASLAEWCDGDRELLTAARADVLRDTAAVQADAAATHREAAELLKLVANQS